MFNDRDYRKPNPYSLPEDTSFYGDEITPWKPWPIPSLNQEQETSLSPSDEAVDMAAALQEIETLRARALEQAQAKGYAEGFEQGQKAGQEQGFKEGRDAGFKEGEKTGNDNGFKAGYENGSTQAQEQAMHLALLLKQSATTVNSLHEELGQALLALGVDVAQHVLQTELREYPDHLLPLLKETLKDVDQTEQAITLLLNPEDIALVKSHLTDELKHNPSWRLQGDKNITVGGVAVQSSLGYIDATLETRWRRALSRLGPSVAASRKKAL